jgi:hypothetical protein
MQTPNDIQIGFKEILMPRKLKHCKACGIERRNFDRDDPRLCGRCSDDIKAKREYSSETKYNLPEDDTTEEEFLALISLNISSEAQRVMEKRIERVTKLIQDNWTDAQRERRSVSKKKSYSLPSLSSSERERKHQWITT